MDFSSLVRRVFVKARGTCEVSTDPPTCQRCGGAMRYKVAEKGWIGRDGAWYCTNYPLCRAGAVQQSAATRIRRYSAQAIRCHPPARSPAGR